GAAADGDCGLAAAPGTCAGGPPRSAPFWGDLQSGSGGSIVDLGLGCAYLGGGSNNHVAGVVLGGGGSSRFSLSGSGSSLTVGPDAGTGPSDCTLAGGPG